MEEKTNQKSKKIRSVAYPAISLEQALNLVEKLRKNAGPGPYNRLSASEGLGYSGVSGTSAARVAALAHFGLLTKKGGTYRQGELADKILLPNTETEKQLAITEAAKTPKLYSKLIEKFSGQALPLMLKNLLAREFKVNERVAGEVEGNFRASMEFAGILKNGILSADLHDSQGVRRASESQTVVKSVGEKRDAAELHDHNLPSGIILQVPRELNYEGMYMGRFKEGIKKLEDAAQEILQEKNQLPDTQTHNEAENAN